MTVGAGAHRTLTLAPTPESVSMARRHATALAREWGLEALVSDLQLVVSELVTNAVFHAGTQIDVTVVPDGSGVRVEVRDGSLAPVVPRPVVSAATPTTPSLLHDDDDVDAVVELLGAGATTGRGLYLVGSVASSWGVTRLAGGKVVWAHVDVEDEASGSFVAGVDDDVHVDAVGHPVRLVAVPVRLAMESTLSLDALVREFQVAGGDSERGGGAVRHIATVVELLERLGTSRALGERAVQDAVERGNRLTDIDLLIDDETVPLLRELNAVLDALSAYSDSGDLLAMTPTAEVREFRGWCADEVDRQLQGRSPTPCPSTVVDPARLAAHRDSVGMSTEASDAVRRLEASLADVDNRSRVVRLLLDDAIAWLGATHASVSLCVTGTDTVEIADSIGMPGEVSAHWRTFSLSADLPASEAIRTGQPVALRTVHERDLRYPAFAGTPVLSDDSFVCMPLVGESSAVWGCLTVSYARSREFTSADLRVLMGLCAVTAGALDRVGAAERSDDARRRDEVRDRLARIVHDGGALADRLTAAVAALSPAVGGWAIAFLPRPGGGADLVAVAHPDREQRSLMEEVQRRWPPVRPADAVVRCLNTGAPVVFQVIPDGLLAEIAQDDEHEAMSRRLAMSSLAVAPVAAAGHVAAVVGVANGSGRYVTDGDVSLVEAVAGILSQPSTP